MPILLRCHKGFGPAVTGTALVAADNFSARYDLDRGKGVFSRPSHKLTGQSYVDRILVLGTAKGGVATAWMLHDMAARGLVPRGLIFNRVNPILAQGAAFGGVALVDRFAGDVTQIFHTGDELRVDPSAGLVEILNRDAYIPYKECRANPEDSDVDHLPLCAASRADRMEIRRQ